MSAPEIDEREIELVNQVLQSTILAIGPMTTRFEQLTSSFIGTRHAAAVSNGTCGLHLCVVAA